MSKKSQHARAADRRSYIKERSREYRTVAPISEALIEVLRIPEPEEL